MLTAARIKEQLTTEDIIRLFVEGFGSDEPSWDRQGHPIFNTRYCHEGGDSDKLYYYPENQRFKCYTCSASKDIFEITKFVLDTDDFSEAARYIIRFFNLDFFEEDEGGVSTKTDDWALLDALKSYEYMEEPSEPLPAYNDTILNYFMKATPREWIEDHINAEVMEKYEIMIDPGLQKIIIPQRDENGNLVGIRGRSFDTVEIAQGKKYMPIRIEDTWYACPSGQLLYGLYYNKETIRKYRKVVIFESEKSVMQMASFNGLDNCYGVATSGSSISKDQIKMLLDLGVEEVTLGYDRDFEGFFGDDDTTEYEKKLLRIIQPLSQYFNTYVIMDYDHLGPYKSSPTDSGKEVFETLYKNRIRITSINERKLR